MTKLFQSWDSALDRVFLRSTSHGMLRLSWLVGTIACFSPILVIATVFTVTGVFLGRAATPNPVKSQFEFPTLEESLAQFWSSIIVAPLLETFLMQYLLIEGLRKLKLPLVVMIGISGLLFGLGHARKGLQAVLITTFVGLVLAGTYVLWLRRTDSRTKAFAAVALTHAIYNGYYLLLMFVPASWIF